jgi:polyhydroxyalkanoate synthesis regulator phasin
MDVIKIIAIVLGATGFWKLAEVLVQYGMQKRVKNAEVYNLNVQANSLVIENYKLWAENMERRLKQLESKNTVMNKTITKQRDRITELEKYVDQLEAEIQSYKKTKQDERR